VGPGNLFSQSSPGDSEGSQNWQSILVEFSLLDYSFDHYISNDFSKLTKANLEKK
jgi:hypothetical protein